MKKIVPIPCTQKLMENNFCTKCNHHIPDYSNLSTAELQNRIKLEKPQCGTFSSEQRLSFNNPIFNVLLFSTIGLLSTKNLAQHTFTPNSLNQTIELEQKEFELIIKDNLNDFKEDFRLLINGELITEKIESDKKIKIQFEAIKDQEIHISIQSNQLPKYFNISFKVDKLPKTIEIERTNFHFKSIKTGKIAYPGSFSNQFEK